MSDFIEFGALAKVTRDIPDLALRMGQLIVIEDYVSAEASEDGTPFYWASSHGTGNMNDVIVYADAVELVKTSEQMNSRRIPTLAEVRNFLGFALLEVGDGFDISETDYFGEDGVEIAGKTSEGLPFVATIQITSIYEADF